MEEEERRLSRAGSGAVASASGVSGVSGSGTSGIRLRSRPPSGGSSSQTEVVGTRASGVGSGPVGEAGGGTRSQGWEGNREASGSSSTLGPGGKPVRRVSKGGRGSKSGGVDGGRGRGGGGEEAGVRKGSRPSTDHESAVAAYKRALEKVRRETIQEGLGLRQAQALGNTLGSRAGRLSSEVEVRCDDVRYATVFISSFDGLSIPLVANVLR